MIKLKNDHPIFFRLPSIFVEQIEEAAYDLRTSRTEFIRQAIFRALDRTKADVGTAIRSCALKS
jgi:Arc/MetJ-type ribon-helix-helix transcriptional regulator